MVDGVSDGERAAGAPMADKWRHLRDVLARRTPGALIWVDRGGATFRTANGDWTMRLAVSGAGTDPERRDADLAALSILWNCADELLSDLARERARAATLRQMLASLDVDGKRLSIVGPEDSAVEVLCERWGYGAVMDAAYRLWRRIDPVGAMLVGPCVAVARDALAADRPVEGSAPGDAGDGAGE